MKTTLAKGLGCMLGIGGLLVVLFANQMIFPRPKLVLIESFLGSHYAVDLPHPLPTDPAATTRWILVTAVGVLACLAGVWLFLKARRKQEGNTK